MTETHAERRRFKRIAFNARTELCQGAHRWPVTLVDLSLKGALVRQPEAWSGDPSQPFTLDIHLDDQVRVLMEARLSHEESGQLGFACTHIDLDSVTHLKRLIELNLGDPAELDRELGALLAV